jgi:hypothetical protein
MSYFSIAKWAFLAVILGIVAFIGYRGITYGAKVSSLETKLQALSLQLEETNKKAQEREEALLSRHNELIAQQEKIYEQIRKNADAFATAQRDLTRLRQSLNNVTQRAAAPDTPASEVQLIVSELGDIYQECRSEYRALGYEAASLRATLDSSQSSNQPQLGPISVMSPPATGSPLLELYPAVSTTTASPGPGGTFLFSSTSQEPNDGIRLPATPSVVLHSGVGSQLDLRPEDRNLDAEHNRKAIRFLSERPPPASERPAGPPGSDSHSGSATSAVGGDREGWVLSWNTDGSCDGAGSCNRENYSLTPQPTPPPPILTVRFPL